MYSMFYDNIYLLKKILQFPGKSEHAGQHCESSRVGYNGHKWSCSLRQDSSVP